MGVTSILQFLIESRRVQNVCSTMARMGRYDERCND